MCLLRALAIVLAAAPAQAQDGERFVNDAMGFEARLPAAFSTSYADAEMEIRSSPDGAREILLLGANSFDPLERLVERHMAFDEQDGWTTRLVASTPSWAAYSGSRNGMLTLVRMIEICPRWQFARLQVTYPERDAVAITPLLDGLVASFKATGTATCQ